jgi:hypothetical protein
VQALLQLNARVDAADSDGCDPARELSPSACSVEHSRRADRMMRRASGLGAQTAVQYGCHSMERVRQRSGSLARDFRDVLFAARIEWE